ncbi:MAG: patatin family protein [Ruminococcus sp.]|nr:patatin family protein [Ruminococcus sp.]
MLGITCEGGASRTVYSCGILDKFLDESIMCDRFIGVSAGIAFGVSYISKQRGRNLSLASDFMPTRKYMGAHHLLRPSNMSFYNLDYAFNEIPNSLLPFDMKAFAEFEGSVEAVVTNVDTGRAEYLECPRDDREFTLLRASCALPMLFPMIEIGGKRYLDGGLADSIPFKHMIEQGCDKNIVILTRPRGYVKKDEPLLKLMEKRYKKYPELVDCMRTRAQRYNECVAELEQLRREGKVFVFSPKHTFGVNRTENDRRKLRRLYDYGYAHAEHELENLRRYLYR